MSQKIESRIKEVKESIIWNKGMITQIKNEIRLGIGDLNAQCNQIGRYVDRLARARDEFNHLKGEAS